MVEAKYRYQHILDGEVREQITCNFKDDLVSQMNDIKIDDIKCMGGVTDEQGIELKPEDLFCISCKKPITVDDINAYDGHCSECYDKWCASWKKATT